MAYQYRGDLTLTAELAAEDAAAIAEPAKAPGFDPSRCGTYANYRQHQTYGVPICDGCRAAMSAYSRDLYQRHQAGEVIKGFRPDACGTRAGYKRHMRHDVPPCPACKAAHAEQSANYRARVAA